MPANRYIVGQVARLALNVKVAGADTNPSSVFVHWTWEDGTTGSAGPLTADDVGDFHHDLVLDRAGMLWYAFAGTGVAAGAGHKSLVVEERRA